MLRWSPPALSQHGSSSVGRRYRATVNVMSASGVGWLAGASTNAMLRPNRAFDRNRRQELLARRSVGGGGPVNINVRPRLRPSHGGSGVASAQPRHYRRRATSCGRPQPHADAHARSSFRRLGLRATPAAGIVSEASARQRAWPALRPARHQGTQPDGSASRRRRDGQNPSSMAAAEDDEMNPAGPNPAFERTRREATSSSKPRWRRAAQLRR